jgi:hypothetical protein
MQDDASPYFRLCIIGWLFILSFTPHVSAEEIVNTVADLRAIPVEALTNLQTVRVGWYSSPQDGGGGLFFWSADSAAPDDGGLVIRPTTPQPRGRWMRVLAEPGVLLPAYFGAQCNGRGDDAPAINKALSKLRQSTSVGDMEGQTGVLRLGARQCTVMTTIDATKLASAAVMIEGTGGSLLCKTTGEPCIDAMDSARLAFRDLSLYGDKNSMPRIGLQLGRPTPHASAAGMYLDHVSISGFFSFTAFYNLNAETQLDLKLNASNAAVGGFGAVYDGINHWNARSAFVAVTSPHETMQSFNDNTCVDCRLTSSGAGGTPVWIAGTAELTFDNCYISNFNTGIGAVLYGVNTNPSFDAHFEANLTSVFLLTGSSHPTIYGLRYREHDFFGGASLFALGPDAMSANLQNVDINIGRFHHRDHGTWFDNPAKYTMTGRVSGVTDQGWVLPGGGFFGEYCFANRCGSTVLYGPAK